MQEPNAPHQPTRHTLVAEIIAALEENWLPAVYRERVLSQRTRSFELKMSPRVHSAEILHTLLGIELRVGRKRLSCPDLATARYLMVFARIGCHSVAVPYNITQISRLADELESAWQRLLLLTAEFTKPVSIRFAAAVKTFVIQEARREIMEAGAGPRVPQFNQNTKQRSA